MSYFSDLSVYQHARALLPYRNVGWLDDGHPFSNGEPPEWLIPSLIERMQYETNKYRGCHRCPFCEAEDLYVPNPNGRPYILGHAELRLGDGHGMWYSAPTLVIHYISAHGYLPPLEFIDAVRGETPEDAVLCRVDDFLMFSVAEDAELREFCDWIKASAISSSWRNARMRAMVEGDRVALWPSSYDDITQAISEEQVRFCYRSRLGEAVDRYFKQ